jgi:putative RNA 2'-phosphotransferase
MLNIFIYQILVLFLQYKLKNEEEMKNILVEKGKELSWMLRHDKDAYNQGKIDQNGWRDVDEILLHGFTRDLLDDIVMTNNKKRFEYNPDKTKLRARQGHSIPVDVELKEMTPPDVLYHGTATRFIDSIKDKGLIPGTRLYVHLSIDEETAVTVGSRHGEPYVIKVDCKQMVKDGIKFYLSNNNVWLTEHVPVKYLTF